MNRYPGDHLETEDDFRSAEGRACTCRLIAIVDGKSFWAGIDNCPVHGFDNCNS